MTNYNRSDLVDEHRFIDAECLNDDSNFGDLLCDVDACIRAVGRQVGDRDVLYAQREIALRPKAMFRAPFGESFIDNAPPYVAQLLSEESLQKSGYFAIKAVRAFYEIAQQRRVGRADLFSSMGLASALSTQLWHHRESRWRSVRAAAPLVRKGSVGRPQFST